MNAVQYALWYIESHFPEIRSLEEVATQVGVSPFHLTRAFSIATGNSVMRYVRGRRLTEAARALAKGAPNILSVAMEAGYGSHEAFSRAFRDQFGLTPENVRQLGHLDNLPIMEPIIMPTNTPKQIEPIRIETGKPMLLAGHCVRYSCAPVADIPTRAEIPSQWQKFGVYLGRIPGQIGKDAYGVCSDFDEDGNFNYLCGVETKEASGLPNGFTTLRLAAQRYAVFAHREHVSLISGTWDAIMGEWFPRSGQTAVQAPQFEKYFESFDPRSGLGGMEIWVPIAAA
ncbi:MAG: AraC family transcriptional regulator [Fibrobacteria bacterium]